MAVHKATHVSRPRIYLGLKEIKSKEKLEKSRIRKSGGGRKKVTQKYAGILALQRNLAIMTLYVVYLIQTDPQCIVL